MLKESITPQDVCDLLNELIKLDRDCIESLISYRVKCNEDIAEHPSVQVLQTDIIHRPKLGLMGILNGLFGVRDTGLGPLCYELDEKTNKIINFKLTSEN